MSRQYCQYFLFFILTILHDTVFCQTNTLPVGINSEVAAVEGGSYTFTSTDFGFSDADAGDTLFKISIQSSPINGFLLYNGADFPILAHILIENIHLLTYTHTGSEGPAEDFFYFKVHDGSQFSVSSASMNIDIQEGPPVAPIALPSSITALEVQPITFNGYDFDYTDLNGDPLIQVAIVQFPANGTLSFFGQPLTVLPAEIDATELGYLSYMPNPGSGMLFDSLYFMASDGELYSDTASMFINVTHVGYAPQPLNDTISLAAGSIYALGAENFQFTDLNLGDTLIRIGLYVYDAPSQGVLLLNGAPFLAGNYVEVDASLLPNLTYVANEFLTSQRDSLEFRVQTQMTGSEPWAYWSDFYNRGTVVINLTAPPTPPHAISGEITTVEGQGYAFALADFGYFDINAEPMQNIKIEQIPQNGALTLNGSTVSNADEILAEDIVNLLYVPNFGAAILFDSLAFRVNDGNSLSENIGKIIIHVLDTNALPIAISSDITIFENESYVFSPANFEMTDFDGDNLTTIKITTLPTNGNLFLNASPVLAGQTLSLFQILHLNYLPNSGFGSPFDSIGFRVSDGIEFSENVANITIHVTHITTPPTALSTEITTPETTLYHFVSTDFGYIDAENDTLFSVRIEALPAKGTLKKGIYYIIFAPHVLQPYELSMLTYLPDEGFGAPFDSLVFSVSDGFDFSENTAKININVTKLVPTTGTPSTEIVIFPNQTSGLIYVQTTLSTPLGCTLFDVSGHKLAAWELQPSHPTIDISDFAAGSYFLLFTDQNGDSVAKKVIKL